ncbi:MAG: hypothetical protein P3T54_09190 [Dehalogenimonas sp.]|uniref:N-acetyltransferase domain-containing protein n=1 Tax=Candidatus Dehalogenimonas loeffleri TaxID=3127115 RepID=A0ABZ2J210_9CHLR|nr:hypothetical protein [Dehalogenimonas sp.]
MNIIKLTGPDDRPGINAFLETARQVYAQNPIRVAESDQAFLQRYKARHNSDEIIIQPFVALKNEHPVARGCAILNKGSVDEDGGLIGWIGFFEALENHQDAGGAILKECESFLRTAGAKSVLAPKVDNLLVGLLVSGFDQPQTILTNYNPPYYPEIFRKLGYRVTATMRTFNYSRSSAKLPEVKLSGFTTREFNLNRLPGEIVIFNRLQNTIFAGSHNYTPRTLEQDREMVASLLPFIDPELIIIAEDAAGEAVGLLICLPDVYQSFRNQEIKRGRVISIGVVPGWKTKGVGALMGSHLARNLLKKGYEYLEASWILSDNLPPQNLAKRFIADDGKEFVLLGKSL